MKKFQLLSVLMLVLVMGMSSCKYEEGPFISVIPKVERVTNTWIVSNATIDGTQSSSISWLKQMTCFKDGGLDVLQSVLGLDVPYTGTWAFTDDKSGLTFLSKDDATGLFSFDRDLTILKLKEDLLKVTWIEPSSGADEVYVVEFVPSV